VENPSGKENPRTRGALLTFNAGSYNTIANRSQARLKDRYEISIEETI
jgi:hypothetical protein